MAITRWCRCLALVLGWILGSFEIHGDTDSPRNSPASQSWRQMASLMEPSQGSFTSHQNLASDLGSQNFSVREKATKSLLILGLRARKPLREALLSPDPEVRLRAREIMDQVPSLPNSWEIRSWLGSEKKDHGKDHGNERIFVGSPRNGPPLTLLLTILDTIDDESLRLAIHCWLARHYTQADLPKTLSESQTDRALCQFFKGFHGSGDGSVVMANQDPFVEYHFLRGQFESGKSIPVARLAEVVASLPQECQHDVESILLSKAPGASTVSLGTGSRLDLAAFVSHWTKDKEVLVRNSEDNKVFKKGLFVCEYDGAQGGRLCRLEEGGSLVPAQNRLQGPNDFHILSGDRVLVAERNSCQITLRNSKGDIHWAWQAPSAPIQCKRLEGGKTFYATFTDIGIVNHQGRVELSLPIKDGVRFATPTPDNCFLVLNSRGELLRLDARGTILHTLSHCAGSSGSGYWGHVITRANGNLIVAFAGTHMIAEIGPKGDLVRQASVRCPVNVKEREDGGLWVCSFDSKSLVELDSQWVQTRKIPLEGRPFGFGRMD